MRLQTLIIPLGGTAIDVSIEYDSGGETRGRLMIAPVEDLRGRSMPNY